MVIVGLALFWILTIVVTVGVPLVAVFFTFSILKWVFSLLKRAVPDEWRVGVSFVLLPVIFFLDNLVYWSYFSSGVVWRAVPLFIFPICVGLLFGYWLSFPQDICDSSERSEAYTD